MSLWDLFQHFQIADSAERIERLRHSVASRTGADARQDRRLEALELDVQRAASMLTAVLDLLRQKGLASDSEIGGAIDKAMAEAEQVAKDEAAAAAALKSSATRTRSSRRYRGK